MISLIQRLLDRLLQRHRPPGFPRRREGFLAELGADGSDDTILIEAIDRVSRLAKREEKGISRSQQPCS